jgi:hypothetical protein
MTGVHDLRLVDEDPAAAQPEPPRVFVRAISTPPGLPWDQHRAAALEARMGAPLPLDTVAWQLRRLSAWRSDAPGRFAAFYVRAQEVRQRLTTEVEVEGRRLQVDFLSPAERARRQRLIGGVAAAAAVAAMALAGTAMLALQARSDAAARLDMLEQKTAARLRQAEKGAALKGQALILDRARMRGRSLGQALDDLAQVSAAKAPDARVQAFHWDRGYVAVEVRGDAAPFPGLGARMQKSARPLRPGVWLWIMAPPGPRAAAAGARP